MSLSMYRASAPVFVQTLAALVGVLDKAAAAAADRKIDQGVLLQTRLYPNMFPFARQIQICTDHAKGGMARLAGRDVPSWPDAEANLDDLKARVQRTIEFVEAFKPADIDGSEDRTIKLKVGPNEMSFRGDDYLLSFALPNFYFHGTTAYAILRSVGIEIGKRDFLGRIRTL